MTPRTKGILVILGTLLFAAGLLMGRLSNSGALPVLKAAGEIGWTTLSLRPLHFPSVAADGLCPQSKAKSIAVPNLTNVVSTSVRGEEPVYMMETGPWHGGIVIPASLSSPNRVYLFVSPQYQGSILIRGKRLDDGTAVLFANPIELRDPGTAPAPERHAYPEEIDPQIPRAGTASVDGRIVATYAELRLPGGDGRQSSTGSGSPSWRLFSWLQVPIAPGCYAVQADGATLSTVAVLEVPGR